MRGGLQEVAIEEKIFVIAGRMLGIAGKTGETEERMLVIAEKIGEIVVRMFEIAGKTCGIKEKMFGTRNMMEEDGIKSKIV